MESESVRLFRRRFLPDEITELKDDRILSISEKLIITKWDVLKPRPDISEGISAYFIDLGIKVSKIYNANHQFVYWYCDIIQTEYNEEENAYTFNDLLIDVLILPDGQVQVVDIDEFADIMEENILDKGVGLQALRQTQNLLNKIYSGKFAELSDYIDNAERGEL